LFPLVDLFQRLWRFEADETLEEKCGKLKQRLRQYRLPVEETVPLFASLLSLPLPEDYYPPLNLSPQHQRKKTLDTIIAILLEHAEHQPVLFIIEDLHWTDPSTLEWLNLVLDQTPTASLLVLLTCRPHFQPVWHHRSYLTEITVHRLSPAHVEQIVTRMTNGKTFPAEVLQPILAKTDGVPLFVEELTKAIVESGQLTAVDGHYELTGSLSPFAIPATLQDSLMARLDRLVTAKAVAQYAAVIGRQFPYDLLQAVSQVDEAMLQHELGRLVEAEIVYQRGVPPQATYTFKHALIQDTAYQALLKSTRQQYHQRIAQVLEARFPAAVETQPELLAHHYMEAGVLAQAISYWQRAGQRAIERSALLEAIAHLTKGLEVLRTLADTPERAQQELELQTALGLALMTSKGFGAPEVLHAYAQARALCQQVGETPQLFPVLWGLWRFYFVRAEHRAARELAEQCLSLAQRVHDPALLLVAHHALGGSVGFQGELSSARAHLEQGLTLYNPQEHRALAFRYGLDLKVWCLAYMAWPLWLLGYPDQALTRSHEAIALAQELSHPISLAAALAYAAWLHHARREGTAAQERAEAAIEISSARGFAQYLAVGKPLYGWALAVQGQGEEGLAQLCQGLAALKAMGSALDGPRFLLLLAEAYGEVGQIEEGLTALTEGLATAHHTGERWWEAELYRLKGELLLRRGTPIEEGEACFQQALAVVRHQKAKALELRAAMSLARLWQQQGKRAEARELLAPVYGWFTEGFDTADLQEARALLEELEE
jgi:predicted ATPase